MRTPLVIGNWKMNLDHHQAAEWLEEYKKKMDLTDADEKHEIITAVLPSFTSLYTISKMSNDMGLELGFGAQNVSEPKSGAFTGDISADMLKALDCKYVLIGHSEQRRYHPEDDDRIADKVRVVLDNHMTPIICIGETRKGREHGIGIDYALNQLTEAVSLLDNAHMSECIIAYEPVWSIGTGVIPTIPVIESALSDIRDYINAVYGKETADKVSILYGGSVKPSNADSIIKCHDCDGFLIGGASLDPAAFTDIIMSVINNHNSKNRRIHAGVSLLTPDPAVINDDMFDWHELTTSDALARAHDDTVSWRAQLALAAYRTVGFKWLEKVASSELLQSVDSSGAVYSDDEIIYNPDLLRDEIWERRLEIIRRMMLLIDNHRIRGVKSVDEWLIIIDDTLAHDDKCEKLTEARADADANVAYDELIDGSMDRNQFMQVFKAGYLSADADTRNRHWRRRGIDKKVMKPWHD